MRGMLCVAACVPRLEPAMNRPIHSRARLIFGAILLFAAAGVLHAQATGGASAIAPPPPAAPPSRGLVLVELFTSEGCPHCPDADALLERLYTEQSVEGAVIVPLEEHVDYWDRREWVDHFSSAGFTQRQKSYADALDVDSVYTPQMIVDGLVEFVGNNEARARATIAALGHAAITPLRFEPVEPRPAQSPPKDGAQVHLQGEGLALAGPAVVYLALAEDKLLSQVGGGSNAGETWRHSSVARWFYSVGKLAPGEKTFSAGLTLPAPDPQWRVENLRLIAIVQEEESRKVAGLGVARWTEVVGPPKPVPAAAGPVSTRPAVTSNASGHAMP